MASLAHCRLGVGVRQPGVLHTPMLRHRGVLLLPVKRHLFFIRNQAREVAVARGEW